MRISQATRRYLRFLGIASLSTLVAFTACGPLFTSRKGEAAQKELEQEFKAVTPLPGASPRNYHASHKSGQALVGGAYSTNLPDEELARRGWKFHEEYGLEDWGRDFGGRKAEYCKGGYKASLQYAGERADYGWVFALDLSWGLDSLVDRWQGNICK
jgi:hypothetical protein